VGEHPPGHQPEEYRGEHILLGVGAARQHNRPGGNLTGVAALTTDVATKRLELLHKAVPATQIAFLTGPADIPNNQVETRLMHSAARALGLRLQVIDVTADTELAQIFATLVEQQVGAIVGSTSAIVRAKRNQILTLAARYGLPTMFTFGSEVRGTGGLFSYGQPIPAASSREKSRPTSR
jgi:putative tryptophan/tyrosine transport system substrate-binding protein